MARRSPRLLGALERPGDVFRHLGPNWFALGDGHRDRCQHRALLPVHIAGLRAFAVGEWLLVATMLVLLTAATAVHWQRYPEHARRTTTIRRWLRSTGRRRWRCSPSALAHYYWSAATSLASGLR